MILEFVIYLLRLPLSIRLYDAKENDQGWVPYFNMHFEDAVGAKIRAVFIDPDLYGLPMDNLFPQ